MTRLPLRMVQPLNAWAAVTESTVFRPMHTLGHRPAQGLQLSLQGEERSVFLWFAVYRTVYHSQSFRITSVDKMCFSLHKSLWLSIKSPPPQAKKAL